MTAHHYWFKCTVIMTGDLILSVLMLAGIALLIGAYRLWRKREDRKKAALMLVAAVVMFANVAIWLVPTPQGETLAKVTAD